VGAIRTVPCRNFVARRRPASLDYRHLGRVSVRAVPGTSPRRHLVMCNPDSMAVEVDMAEYRCGRVRPESGRGG